MAAVEMIVERQASPVAETCDDARGESGDNERGNGNPVAAERGNPQARSSWWTEEGVSWTVVQVKELIYRTSHACMQHWGLVFFFQKLKPNQKKISEKFDTVGALVSLRLRAFWLWLCCFLEGYPREQCRMLLYLNCINLENMVSLMAYCWNTVIDLQTIPDSQICIDIAVFDGCLRLKSKLTSLFITQNF